MNKIKNVIFDVGMVLVDFRWHDYMMDLGISEPAADELGKRMIMSEFWKELDRGAALEKNAPDYFKGLMPEYAEEIDLFWKNPKELVREFDYAAPMIRGLKKAGYRVYLLSNYPAELSELHWPAFSFFHDIDGKIISAVEGLVKPEEQIYRLLMKRYRLKPEECIFLDDREDNINTARKLGMTGIVFYSYEEAAEELKKAGVLFG